MKHVKSLMKLTNLNSESVNEKELDRAIAGALSLCMCGCWYSECGGSSSSDNTSANSAIGAGSAWPGGQAEWNYASSNRE